MKHLFSSILILLSAVLAFGQATPIYTSAPGDALPLRIWQLDNGLTVYLSRNTEKPEIQAVMVIRAGSKNDPLTDTGMAHYLEHLMFKGTRRFGTISYAQESVHLARIDSLYERYRTSSSSDERLHIYHLIDSISGVSSHYAIAGEYGKLMDDLGAREVNAFTSFDKTSYHQLIPSGELERWAAIESERMSDMVIRAFHTELETVYEEYNITATSDDRRIVQAANALLYPELSSRQHPVIGLPEHLKNPSPAAVRHFYNTYYRPNNAALILSGDLDYDSALCIVTRYFGRWQAEPLPVQEPLRRSFGTFAMRDTVIGATETPAIMLCWRFPPLGSPEASAADMLALILQNGQCGLFDRDLLQPRRVLSAWAYTEPSPDYTTFYLYALPREGQSLSQLRDLLLAEIDSLREGRFSEELLRAIAANCQRNRMQDMRSNRQRADFVTRAFASGMPYNTYCANLSGSLLLSRDSLIRVAQRYLTSSYAVIYKDPTLPVSVPHVDKPAITPICMNRDSISPFRDSLLRCPGMPVMPAFVDYSRDIIIDSLAGRELLSRRNTDDSLFTLTFIAPIGAIANPRLCLAADALSLVGTADLTPAALRQQLYSLACDVRIRVTDGETRITLSGLASGMPEALALLQAHLSVCRADKHAFRAMVADKERARQDARRDRDQCANQLQCVGYYGIAAMRHVSLTADQMKRARPTKLLRQLRQVASSTAQVVYFGPLSADSLQTLLSPTLFFSGRPMNDRHERLAIELTNHPEVLVLPFDAPNVLLTAYADWGEVYRPEDEAVIALFNEYFGGSMGSLVWQEMRESRSLAYSASAAYCLPDNEGDCCFLTRYVLTQPDKLADCIRTFDLICDSLPASEASFHRAKAALLAKIASRRYVRSAPLFSLLSDRRKGWTSNRREEIYQAVERLTLDDLLRFQQTHVTGRTYRYMIVGDVERIDPELLRSLGHVRILSTDDIFF